MNISANKLAVQAIICLVLAGSCPEDQKDKLKNLEKWATKSKDKLLIEVENFLLSEAERLINNEEEFDRYYTKFINEAEAEKFLDEKLRG